MKTVTFTLGQSEPISIRPNEQYKIVIKKACTNGIYILDGNGRPIPDVPVIFSFDDEEIDVSSDSNGLALCPSADTTFATVKLSKFKEIRKAVVSHWNADTSVAESNVEPNVEEIPNLPLKEPLRSLEYSAGEDLKVIFVPSILRCRLIGMFFDTAKCFLLPSAMESIRALKNIYDQYEGAHLLLVGHTDDAAASGPAYNDTLSLERADAIAAFLQDKVDDWYTWYGNGISWEKKWDSDEDKYMLSVLPNKENPYYKQGESLYQAYKAFQDAKDLPPSGKGDEATRKALIKNYMAQDETTLPPDIDLTTHGCGQYFPDVEKPAGSETTAQRDERRRQNRRVEIFLFDGAITPPPEGKLSGPNSTDYPAWKAAVTETIDLTDDDADADDWPDLSARFVSSMGRIPVADKPYKVYLNNGKQVSGTTDGDGKIFHAGIEAGDYDADVDGNITIVNTVPKSADPVEVAID